MACHWRTKRYIIPIPVWEKYDLQRGLPGRPDKTPHLNRTPPLYLQYHSLVVWYIEGLIIRQLTLFRSLYLDTCRVNILVVVWRPADEDNSTKVYTSESKTAAKPLYCCCTGCSQSFRWSNHSIAALTAPYTKQHKRKTQKRVPMKATAVGNASWTPNWRCTYTYTWYKL